MDYFYGATPTTLHITFADLLADVLGVEHLVADFALEAAQVPVLVQRNKRLLILELFPAAAAVWAEGRRLDETVAERMHVTASHDSDLTESGDATTQNSETAEILRKDSFGCARVCDCWCAGPEASRGTDCGQPVWAQGCWQGEAGYTFGRRTPSR